MQVQDLLGEHHPGTFAEYLVVPGANVRAANGTGVTPLHWAATDLEKTRMLLDAVPDVGMTGRQRIPVKGEIPNPINPPTGCPQAAQTLGWGAPANCFIQVSMTYVPAAGSATPSTTIAKPPKVVTTRS